MFKFKNLLIALLMMFVSGHSSADVILMVHGYQSNADDWRRSGIVSGLGQANWLDAGVLYLNAQGNIELSGLPPKSEKLIYTANLPSEFPLTQQSQALEAYINELTRRFPNQRIILIGHSAGGVIARSALVRASRPMPVTQLITIASPHLGTDAAVLGSIVANSPFAIVAPMIGAGTLNRSQQLYKDLLPESPGTLLFMLNRQQHPRIEYISIVRGVSHGLSSDLVVPQDSQRMENVFALRGLARSIVKGYGHGLQASDADTIIHLIEGPRSL